MKDQRLWIKVTHEFYQHPKTLTLNDKAFRALIGLWCHAGRYKTDGFLSKNELKMFATPSIIRQLESAGFLEKNSAGDEWYLHDWAEHQVEREVLEKKTDYRVSAGKQGGKASAHKRWHVQKNVIDPACEYCKTA